MIQRLQNFQDRAKKSRNLNIFTFLKTRRQCDFFQIDQKDLFFSKSWKFWKKRSFGALQAVRFMFFKKVETVHLRVVQCAKSWINPRNQWFWWAPGSAIWCVHIFWFLWRTPIPKNQWFWWALGPASWCVHIFLIFVENKKIRKITFFLTFLTRVLEMKATSDSSNTRKAPHFTKPHRLQHLNDSTTCSFGEPDGAIVQTRVRPHSVSQEEGVRTSMGCYFQIYKF